ncbi:B3 domain-containing transcription factor FUS3 [Hibiscus syriacus]|uniref:B3 domain-containing transcription factor FUS3 n=1 Tax=Hibiscus syriacus TaxID=106335 RepID=A0A6A3CNF6_HIBSY|nr:B3 domain-containing transcription factor LEC2 [Hibiscus syriacus]KAE8731005.1 B3 domain-containing transcription factor FUS3 [Hibiscus syriacus]
MRSIDEAHLNQRWRQHSLKPTHWSDEYPKTTFRRPLVSHSTTPLATSFLFASLTLYMQFHGLFLSPQQIPLHLLTRFSCLFHTWTHPNGSILHPHDLIEPHFVLTQNRKEHTQSSSLSPTFFPDHHHHCNSLHSSSSHCTFVLMENSYIPFSPTATTTTSTTPTNSTSNMGCSSNSNFSTIEPMSSQFQHPSQLLPPYQSLQLPYRYLMEQAPPMYPCFDFGVWKDQERRIMDPNRTKMARINRKLARQRSLSLQRNATPVASTQVDARRLIPSGINTYMRQNNDTNKDHCNFITPDNKKLRVLLKKELKNSDVGSLGRIVLPKRETEANLPTLYDKEGIQVTLKDVYSNNEWTLKYKFWINNKSRMYVLENTGDFVKQNGMRIGDSLTLYEDESMNLYFSISKVATVAVESSSNQNQYYNNNNVNNNNNSSHIYLASKDDDEASLELLIEQLKHKEPQEPNDLMMTLPMDTANNSQRILPEETRHLFSHDSQMQTSTTLPGGMSGTINFDDCYGGLDMLPDVNHYNFSL